MEEAARLLHRLGASNVVIKGGHMESSEDSDDLLFDGTEFAVFSAKRIDTTSNHGTGCTFASAVASGLASGNTVEQAVSDAKAYVTKSMQNAFPVGKGHGPLNHFHELWELD